MNPTSLTLRKETADDGSARYGAYDEADNLICQSGTWEGLLANMEEIVLM